MTILRRFIQRGITSLVGLTVTLFFLLAPGHALSETADLSKIIFKLVTAYNNQDAASYRQTFSEKRKSEYSLDRIREILSTKMKGQGQIISHNVELSPDGKRALVFLEMEQASFDLHIRVNEEDRIERLTWFSHKADPSTVLLSGHEQHFIQEKYQPIVDKFIQAIRDTNAETVLSMIVEDEDDDMSLEDYRSFLIGLNDRGIQRVGTIEVLSPNEVLVPVYLETGELGFYLGFDKANKISDIRISNYAPNESRGKSYTSLGADTIRTSDLKNFDQLRDDFASDSGMVRFVTLLSPT